MNETTEPLTKAQKQRIRARRWYEKNREKALASEAARRCANRDEIAIQNKAWYESNKDAKRASEKIRYAKKRDAILAQVKAYRIANKEKIKARDAEKYRRRRDVILAQSSRRYSENKDEVKARVALWVKNNREASNSLRRNYKSRKRNAAGAHTADDIQSLFKAQRGKCVYCRTALSKKYHVDHIISLKAGGSNDKTNLQLLCASCNCSKGAKHPVAFAQERGLLL